MIEALDQGLQPHKKMYEVWIKDDTDQPQRAINGMKSGIRAYIRSRAAALRLEIRQAVRRKSNV